MEKKDKNAVLLGRKGGKARAKALTPERRREIAKRGNEVRQQLAQALKTGESA
jgi:hypothetical protein